MLRLLHTADVHLGLTKFGGAYDASGDTAAVLESFVSAAVSQQVDVAIISGDLFHTRRPEPRHLYAATSAIRRLSDEKIHLLISGGNHDGPSTIVNAGPGDHTLEWLSELELRFVHVYTEPTSELLGTSKGELFGVVAVPYPHKRRWDHELGNLSIDQRIAESARRLEAEVRELTDYWTTTGGLSIFVGHLTVAGAITGTEREMQLGWDVTLPAAALEPFDYAALGHIHRQQEVAPRAWYPGSPTYVSFAEEGQEKSFLLVTLRGGKRVDVERIPTGAPIIQTDPDTVAPGAVLRVHADPGESPGDLSERLRALREAGASYIDVVYPGIEAAERIEFDETFDLRQLLTEYLSQRKLPAEPYLSVAQEVIDAC